MEPTPVKIDARPFVECTDSLEYNLLHVSDENGNAQKLIEYGGKTWKLHHTDSNWMAAYYVPADGEQ